MKPSVRFKIEVFLNQKSLNKKEQEDLIEVEMVWMRTNQSQKKDL